MSDVPVLQVTDLVTSFRVGRQNLTAVDHVSFSVGRGETLGLVGESGSGKSMTAMSILRLVPSPGQIESGRLELNGVDLLSLSEEEIRERRGTQCGMVFQNPMTALNPVFSVGWQMGEALRAHGRGRDSAAAVEAALAGVGMPDPHRQANSFPHQMSGGMRQRVVIAMGLLNAPQLLIADEPTTALDVTIQAQVLELMKQLTREKDAALLLITHNMGVIAKMCDRVAVMYAGEIVEEAPVDEIFSNSLHPYTRGLLRSVPDGSRPRQKMPTLKGEPPDISRPLTGCRFRPRCAYADERCGAHPDLLPVREGHKSRCWAAQAGEAFVPARESNQEAGDVA
ncbi:ABC transporter ATP-binding protein [Pelagibius sp. CAU 1746]|uniref:ABC transporter ATP-binding protein n=1 Tax=Pelagibius sp. CAU 1746 TaxID=3140370 RepID=UPI00325B9A96